MKEIKFKTCSISVNTAPLSSSLKIALKVLELYPML